MKTRYLSRLVIGALTLAAGTLAVGCSEVRWETSYDEGMRRATEEHRRVLVEFVSAVCADCMDMNANVFPIPEVEKLMKNFVPVRLDTMLDKELAARLNVKVAPSFYVIRQDGRLVGVQEGALDADSFRTFLIKYSYN